MMTNDPSAKSVIMDFERMKSERSTYESAWRDIRQYVRPNTVDFNGSNSPGDVRTERMYDGAAMQANTDLAGEVWTELFSPVERTFGIAVAGDLEINRLPEVREWTDYVADMIAQSYADERSQLTSSGHEAIQDITAFGNCVISQEWNDDEWQLLFQARPLACCFFRMNKNGVVDTLAREEKMTLRQILQKWPDATWDRIEEDKKQPERMFCVIHLVQPRADKERIYGRKDGKNMAFASCWVLKEKCVLLEEGGYTSFPYHCPRWNKVADETYGRGPGINCLPGIKMLNRMKLTTLRAAQKSVDPTLWLPTEGVRLPYKDFPGAVNHYDVSNFPNGFDLKTIEHKGNFPVSLEMMEAERLEIRKAFYTDWLEWFPKVERQTAEEIRELSMRKLKKMAPLLGRLQTELLVPMIQRSYLLLDKAGMIPDPPAALEGKNLRVVYVSASAKAQSASEVNGLIQYMQQLIPLAQVDPTVFDAVNIKRFAAVLAEKQHITQRILNSPEEMEAIETGRAEKEQMAQMAGAAEPVSKALLNVAQAQEAGGIV
jgi:hypothetical protein